MAMTIDQIKSAAMDLSPADRETLAEELLLSITRAEADALDDAYLQELQRREEAYAQGKMEAIPVEDVLQRLQAKVIR